MIVLTIRTDKPEAEIGLWQVSKQSLHVDGVQGSQENRTSGIENTESKDRTQLTQQSATINSGVSSSAREQAVELQRIVWEGHQQLSATILKKIEELLHKTDKDWQDIEGIICYKGPGSFTGLRISMSVGNTIAATLGIPIVGNNHEDWIKKGLNLLQKGHNEQVVLPEYGRSPHITPQKR